MAPGSRAAQERGRQPVYLRIDGRVLLHQVAVGERAEHAVRVRRIVVQGPGYRPHRRPPAARRLEFRKHIRLPRRAAAFAGGTRRAVIQHELNVLAPPCSRSATFASWLASTAACWLWAC